MCVREGVRGVLWGLKGVEEGVRGCVRGMNGWRGRERG